MTRRQLLQLGAAAWATAMLGGARSARAAGTDITAPGYLRRGSWAPLAGTAVGVGAATLRLSAVGDLPHLVGRDDAFRLELIGAPGALQGGIHPFRHAALGSFELFVSPVDAVADGVQRYEVVVDRSVGVPRSVPQAPAAAEPAGATPAPAPAHRAHRRRRRRLARRHVRRVRARGRARWRAVRGQAKIAS